MKLPAASIVLLCLCVSLASAGDPDAKIRKLARRSVFKSSGGKFVVSGAKSLGALDLIRWADDVSDRIKRDTGVKPSFANRVVRIRVGDVSTNVTGEAGVAVREAMDGGQFTQMLLLERYPDVDGDAAHEAMFRILLNGYVVASRRATMSAGRVAVRGRSDHRIRTVPFWLSEGMAQNVHPSQRARNRDLAWAAWQEGKLPPLSDFLTLTNSSGRQPICGFVVQWFLQLPDKADRFRALFQTLSAGEAISPEWFVGSIRGCSSFADVEEVWENWLLRQRRVIYHPGRTTPNSLVHLNSELLIYVSDLGIPFPSGVYDVVELESLIDDRNADWMRQFARDKAVRLRLLAVGRGPDFLRVADAYGVFFDGLAEKKSAKRLRKCLHSAESEKAQFESKLQGNGP